MADHPCASNESRARISSALFVRPVSSCKSEDLRTAQPSHWLQAEMPQPARSNSSDTLEFVQQGIKEGRTIFGDVLSAFREGKTERRAYFAPSDCASLHPPLDGKRETKLRFVRSPVEITPYLKRWSHISKGWVNAGLSCLLGVFWIFAAEDFGDHRCILIMDTKFAKVDWSDKEACGRVVNWRTEKVSSKELLLSSCGMNLKDMLRSFLQKTTQTKKCHVHTSFFEDKQRTRIYTKVLLNYFVNFLWFGI